MKIGDEVAVHGYIDEIRKDTIIIRNDGGYFGTAKTEVTVPAPCISHPGRVVGKKIVKSNGMMGYWACDQCGEPIHPDDKYCCECGVKLEGE